MGFVVKQYQWLHWLKVFFRLHWPPLLLGLIATIAVLVVWQELLQEKLFVQSSLPQVILVGGLTASWVLAFMVHLGQQAKVQAQQAKITLQQLQQEIIRRQHVEACLRESEERWQMALRGNNDGIWDWNVKTNEVFFSSRWKEMLGFADHEISNHLDEWSKRVHPDDLEWVTRSIQDHFAQKTPFYISEHRIQCKDGSYKWVLDRGQALWDEAGTVVRMTGSHTDITERKQAEEALRESEARFQAFMNYNPALCWITNSSGRLLYVNPTYSRTIKLPDDYVVGKSDRKIHPTEFAQQYLHNIRQVVETQQVVQAIESYSCADGSIGELLVYKFPIRYHSDSCLVGGIAIDLTERKRMENALQKSEERLQLALEASGDGLWDWDIPRREVYLNSPYQAMLGYPAIEQVIDQSVWEDMIHPEDKPWVLEQLRNHLKDSSIQYSFDYRVRCQSGEWKWIADYGKVVVRDASGKPLRMIGTHKDISDRKHKETILRQAMEAAEAANLAKSMFLANMSHELRTPLNVILGFAQIMAHDASLSSSQKEDLQTIRRSGDHLLNLINDVLDLSKIEAGYCTVEKTGFDLISLLHGLRTMMTERANAKQLQLTFNIAPEVPQFVITDEQKLRQILLNLLSNAIKFTTQGSVTLQVSVESPQTEEIVEASSLLSLAAHAPILLQFEVTDTGVGIDLEEQTMIFDAFVQAEAGKKSVSGTGLGLTISRKLLDLIHGTISVRSVPTQGSVFTCTVPVYATSSVDAQPELHDRTILGLIPGQSHRRILVVDDQPENRLLMARLLTHLGLEVREATDGQEAVQVWRDWHPDLTWMDIRMPGLDGYEATKQIRAMEQEQASIIIALTAQASQSDRALALAAGCNDYISKPFQEETLFLKMSEHLGLKYLYAEPDSLATSQASAANDSPVKFLDSTSFVFPDLTPLSKAWLSELEEAAVCGNDRAILELATRLPPESAQLTNRLSELANQYQFEQILKLVHDHS